MEVPRGIVAKMYSGRVEKREVHLQRETSGRRDAREESSLYSPQIVRWSVSASKGLGVLAS